MTANCKRPIDRENDVAYTGIPHVDTRISKKQNFQDKILVQCMKYLYHFEVTGPSILSLKFCCVR